MSAWSNSTCTWVEVSSTDTSVSIQRRETTSMMANADPLGAREVGRVPAPDAVRGPLQPVRPARLRCRVTDHRFGQHEPVSSQNTTERGRRDPHPPDVGAAVGELAVGAVDLTPLLGDGQYGVDLARCQGVQGDPARRPVLERADRAQPGPPAVHPIIRHAQQPARPGVRGAGGDRLVDQLEDRFLRLARDPSRAAGRSGPADFSRNNASSIAWLLTASVNCAELATRLLQLPVAFRRRAARLGRQRRHRGVLHAAPDPDDRRHVDVPLAGRVGLGDLPRGDLQEDLPLRLR